MWIFTLLCQRLMVIIIQSQVFQMIHARCYKIMHRWKTHWTCKTILCTKGSIVWFQIPYCNQLWRNYSLSGFTVISKTVQNCLKILFPFQNTYLCRPDCLHTLQPKHTLQQIECNRWSENSTVFSEIRH